jgi:DNA polymerase-3 subunit delta'
LLEVDVSWQRVKGHEALATAFGHVVDRGRLAHGYLFTGPPGIGKRFFARELAKALLCESPPAGRFDACDRCPACIQVDAGTHPDLFLVSRPEDKVEFPVEAIHQLSANLGMKPARGLRKIAIVDDADDFNDVSANALLKTLEEPPPGSLLILIATAADRQLSTIRSRCQIIPFTPLPEPVVRDLLKSDADIDPDAVDRLAHISDGSPGLARELAVPALWEFRQKLLAALAKQSPDSPTLAKELQDIVEDVGKDSGAQRRRATLVVRLIVDALRQALSVSVERATSADAGEARLLRDLAQKFGPDGLLRRLDRCLQAATEIDRRVQLVLVNEALIDALAYG